VSRPRLLDAFCGAGGAGVGYHRSGFDVVGVDIADQPDYPFEFHRADALTVLQIVADGSRSWEFDAVHASPPCQHYSSLASLHPEALYVDLYVRVRDCLRAIGRPWVMENVVGAPYQQGVVLCGSMFDETRRLRRHRNFEASFLMLGPECRHDLQHDLLGVYGNSDGAHEPGFKHKGHKRGPRQATTIEAREVMAMPWVTKRKGLTEAIPPAFTEWIGERLLSQVELERAA
jgi:DNA (cytosine-5)-methyltransferase 1